MTNNRNGFTYAANITVLGIALLLFTIMTVDTSNVVAIDDKLNEEISKLVIQNAKL